MHRFPRNDSALATGGGGEALATADYATAVRHDRPLAWWRFAPSAAGDASVVDESGKYPGVIHGKVRLGEAGPIPGAPAAGFSGRGAYLEIPGSIAWTHEALSVELWFKSKQSWDAPLSAGSLWQAPVLPGSATLISKALAGHSSGGWRIGAGAHLPAQNEGRIIVGNGATGMFRNAQLYSPRGLNDGTWHHAVWTRTAGGSNRLYLDGQLADVLSDSGETVANARPLQIGGEALLADGRYFEGLLAEVAIYDRALAPERVTAHWQAVDEGCEGPASNRLQLAAAPGDTLHILRNAARLEWHFTHQDWGWTLGQILLDGQALEAKATAGILALHNIHTDEVRWLGASAVEPLDETQARFTGSAQVDEVIFSFALDIRLEEKLPVVHLDARWSVDRSLDGWEVCLAYHDGFSSDWRLQLYPFAGDSEAVDIARLTYCGVPAALAYREDMTIAALFSTDIALDYLNPQTWTGRTGFQFKNRLTAPQFRVGGGRLDAGIEYHYPLQLFLSDAGESSRAITELVQNWIAVSGYQVEPLQVRTPREALDLFIAGRSETRAWIPGAGYRLGTTIPFIFVPENAHSARVDYHLFERTGQRIWRQRAFEQMDLVLRAQINDPRDPHDGYVHACYHFQEQAFDDRVHLNEGYMVDPNAYLARYLLELWERVKQHEGEDRQDWFQAAVRVADWVVRQQNIDGGLPQNVNPRTGVRTRSISSYRALPALPIIARLTGEERFMQAADKMEAFVRREVEGRFRINGAHVDLPPSDYEQDSIWGLVEYWLDKHARTRDPEALARARADALFSLLFWCPRQLSWVANPTQGAHAEQQNYCQYSVYCYNNRKLQCLDRLARITGEPLFAQLAYRVMQLNFWTQVTEGEERGGVSEAVADPWLDRRQGFNWRGVAYPNELAADLMLQLLEMGQTETKTRAST